MRKFFFLFVAVLSAACAPYMVGGQRRMVLMPQVGVVLSVVNNCAATVSVESGGVVVDPDLPFGGSNSLPLSSRAFSGYNRAIVATVKAYDAVGKYLGSATHPFHVDIYQGTYESTWVVDRLESPPGATCVPPRTP